MKKNFGKRILVTLLGAITALSLTACGTGNSDAQTSSTAQTESGSSTGTTVLKAENPHPHMQRF